MQGSPTPAEEDEMIRLARAKAGGAVVHRVETLCAAYRIFAELVRSAEEGAAEIFQRVEAALQAYIRTGELPPPEWNGLTSFPEAHHEAPGIEFPELSNLSGWSTQQLTEFSYQLREESARLRNETAKLSAQAAMLCDLSKGLVAGLKRGIDMSQSQRVARYQGLVPKSA